MAHLTWEEAKEIVEISLECGYPNQQIVRELRCRTGLGLIDAIQRLLGLLAIADHPLAEERYESLRTHITRLNHAEPWAHARMKLRTKLPIKELL